MKNLRERLSILNILAVNKIEKMDDPECVNILSDCLSANRFIPVYQQMLCEYQQTIECCESIEKPELKQFEWGDQLLEFIYSKNSTSFENAKKWLTTEDIAVIEGDLKEAHLLEYLNSNLQTETEVFLSYLYGIGWFMKELQP